MSSALRASTRARPSLAWCVGLFGGPTGLSEVLDLVSSGLAGCSLVAVACGGLAAGGLAAVWVQIPVLWLDAALLTAAMKHGDIQYVRLYNYTLITEFK